MREGTELSISVDATKSVYDPALNLLSAMIVDEAGDQIWDVENWDIWAGKYSVEATALFATVQRVAGLGGEQVKKDWSPTQI